jgi:hypothetical protein
MMMMMMMMMMMLMMEEEKEKDGYSEFVAPWLHGCSLYYCS